MSNNAHAQAQRNMVRINEERVAALQELDTAYDRIEELGAAAWRRAPCFAAILPDRAPIAQC